MNDYVCNYVTRGGIQLVIRLPLNELGNVLSDDCLSVREKHMLAALQLRAENGERETASVTMH